MRRKWAVDKSTALSLVADLVLKKLIQHSWPCQIVDSPFLFPTSVQFVATKGRKLEADFWDAFDIALRIVARSEKCHLWRNGDRLFLYGIYAVNDYGKIYLVETTPF